MSQEALLWGAFSLMFFGAVISMCMKCQQTASKEEEAHVVSQRTQCEDRQIVDDLPYLSLMSTQYSQTPYNTERHSKRREHPPSLNHLDDDSHVYQNVVGPPKSSGCVLSDVNIYENTIAIKIWGQLQTSGSSSEEEEEEEEEATYINAESNSRFPA